MEYISVKNLEKYLPGYKDRTLSWLKLYFRNAIDTKNNTAHTSIFNDEKFQELDEIDQIRFLKLACMQADTGKPVPMTDRNIAWMGWNTKKRPKSKTLQMLQSFLIVCNSPPKNPAPQNRIDKEKEEDKEEEVRHTRLQFVKLTDKEYESLVGKFGELKAKEWIEELNGAVGSKGYKYKSHYLTILNWARKDAKDSGKTGGSPKKLDETYIR